MINKKNCAGFDLIAITLMLTAVGVLFSIAFLVIPNPESLKLQKTTARIKANKSALIGFAVAKGRVPGTSEVATLLPSQVDGHQRAFGYAYDERLAKAGLCATSAYLTAEGVSNVAMVIFSSGFDGTTTMSGGAQTSSVEYSTGTSDDMLEWVTLGDLRGRLNCER
ncbi:MAG: hypothetical protein HQL96_11155 [Magnetococcales bacterium]|nr:hypothetical protein [Magnetococcales bacterium]